MAVLKKETNKIRAYLAKKHGTRTLGTIDACKELGLRGSELDKVLGTAKLPDLKLENLARFIVLHT